LRLCASFQTLVTVVAQMGSVASVPIGKSFLEAAMGSGSTQSGICALGHGIVGKSSWRLTCTGKAGSLCARHCLTVPCGSLATAEVAAGVGVPVLCM